MPRVVQSVRCASISSASPGVQSSTMRSASSNLRKSELSISSRVYFAGMKLPTLMPKCMIRKYRNVSASTLILRARTDSPGRREARASRSAPAGGQVKRSRCPGTGRDAPGVCSTIVAMCSIAARNASALAPGAGATTSDSTTPRDAGISS